MPRRLTTTQQGYGWRWQQLRLRILQRDGYTCRYCGAYARSVDHRTPKSQGGTDHPSNLVASCVKCNSSRSPGTWNRRGAALRRRRDGTGPSGVLADVDTRRR
jgi:5-methylcytosine-specific restriction endonuclease McrA